MRVLVAATLLLVLAAPSTGWTLTSEVRTDSAAGAGLSCATEDTRWVRDYSGSGPLIVDIPMCPYNGEGITPGGQGIRVAVGSKGAVTATLVAPSGLRYAAILHASARGTDYYNVCVATPTRSFDTIEPGLWQAEIETAKTASLIVETHQAHQWWIDQGCPNIQYNWTP